MNTLIGDIGFLAQVTRARNDWLKEYYPETDLDLFNDWLYNVYGIKLNQDSYGNLTASYVVHDEQKFLLFTLKYAQ